MVIGERKPMDEIRKMISNYNKILVLGCEGCVAIHMAGGEKEVGILASVLRLAEPAKTFVEGTAQRQCEPEFIEEIAQLASECDAILSMACGAGVQHVAEFLPKKRVLPAINTTGIVVTESQGQWGERCLSCGDCVLDRTGGICPITRCSKGLLNGPCGGSQDGMCEIDPEKVACGWQLIYDRLEQLGQLDAMEDLWLPKDWSKAHDGGPRRRIREDMVLDA